MKLPKQAKSIERNTGNTKLPEKKQDKGTYPSGGAVKCKVSSSGTKECEIVYTF